ncbi:HD-GYP domain-containing protein [Falsiroseomonas ponticola]|uniref:HD-GYP domain-containing protein n=1 Tax=Falsiroseomonas ponticola TaxID=2786951 RepID=UPI001932982F|nr:HD domain-containing phosphohydrolase [Roseomonas ponticola]
MEPARPISPPPGAAYAVLLDSYPRRNAALALLARLKRHHPPSAGHSMRVGQALLAMGTEAPAWLGDPATAFVAGLLHDVGKLRVPPGMLDSPSGLDKDGRDMIRAHPEAGAAILAEADFPPAVIEVALGHHERWQGGGYPAGLPAAGLPRLARAVAVADALVAMVEPDRAYRTPLTREAALAELRACAGLQFDPEATAILLAAASRGHAALSALFEP